MRLIIQLTLIIIYISVRFSCFILIFSVQPVLDTRRKQSQLWGDLILNWCRHNKIYELNVTEAANSALFCNQAINSVFLFHLFTLLLSYQRKASHAWN